MWRVIPAALFVGLLSFGAYAQFSNFIPPAASAAGGSCNGHTCAGDAGVTFTSWWSTSFAYSAAKRGTKAVNLCNPGGTNCVDVNSDATTGIVTNAPTVNG